MLLQKIYFQSCSLQNIDFQKCIFKNAPSNNINKKKFKVAPSKNTFTKSFSFKFLPQKYFLKIFFFKIGLSKTTLGKSIFKNTFLILLPLKLLSQEIHYQKHFFWNCSPIKYVFISLPSKSTFSKLLLQKLQFKIAFSKKKKKETFQKYFLKIASSKNQISKAVFRIAPSKHIFSKIAFKINLFFIRIIRLIRIREITKIIINLPNCFFLNILTVF